jgi:hypothetical protein
MTTIATAGLLGTLGTFLSAAFALCGAVLGMALTPRHGKSKDHGAGPVIEVLRPRDQPRAVQDPEVALAGPQRDQHGRFIKGAKLHQRQGGKAKKQWGALANEIAALATTAHPQIAPDLTEARRFFQALCLYFAIRVGGGELGPHVQSFLQRAAIQRAVEMAVWRLALGGLFVTKPPGAIDDRKEKARINESLLGLAERMGAASTRNILAAWELCAKAASRGGRLLGPFDAQDALRASLGVGTDGTDGTDEGGG